MALHPFLALTDLSASRRSAAAFDEPLILVCEARQPAGQSVAERCRAAGVRAETITRGEGLFTMLHYMQPVAVISDVVLDDQDGFHVMKGVAAYDRHLPMLIITGADPILRGAAEAIEEIWGMTRVCTVDNAASAAAIAKFLVMASAEVDEGAGNHPGAEIPLDLEAVALD